MRMSQEGCSKAASLLKIADYGGARIIAREAETPLEPPEQAAADPETRYRSSCAQADTSWQSPFKGAVRKGVKATPGLHSPSFLRNSASFEDENSWNGCTTPTPGSGGCGKLRSLLELHLFVIEFVQVVPNRDQIKLQLDRIQPSSDNALIPAVLFYDPEGALCLNGAVHTQQRSVDAFEVVKNFFMELGKLLIDTDRLVLFCLLTPVRIRASAAILAFVDFLLSPVLIPLDRLSVCKVEFFVIRANQVAICVCLEIDGAERISPMYFKIGWLMKLMQPTTFQPPLALRERL